MEKGGESKPVNQGKVTNDLIYAAGRTLSVPMEDMETTTNGGVGSARKAGKDLCNAICESLIPRGTHTEELLHDLTKRLLASQSTQKANKEVSCSAEEGERCGPRIGTGGSHAELWKL